MSTLFNLTEDTPKKVNIVKETINDRKCINGFIKNNDCLYLFDRCYYNYSYYYEVPKNSVSFITRQISNACIEEVHFYYTELKNTYDYDVIIDSDYSKNKTKFIYRKILTFDKNENKVRLL